MFASVVSYTCDSGAAQGGNASRTCQSDGSWDGTAPVYCGCPALPALGSQPSGDNQSPTTACINTRDNRPGQFSCAHQLAAARSSPASCTDYLRWTDCDDACDLCECSTAVGTTSEHCSGHGTCTATCTRTGCTGAACQCEAGYSGSKCETPTTSCLAHGCCSYDQIKTGGNNGECNPRNNGQGDLCKDFPGAAACEGALNSGYLPASCGHSCAQRRCDADSRCTGYTWVTNTGKAKLKWVYPTGVSGGGAYKCFRKNEGACPPPPPPPSHGSIELSNGLAVASTARHLCSPASHDLSWIGNNLVGDCNEVNGDGQCSPAHTGGCTSSSRCPACAGDCDVDGHCEEGLRCFQRHANDTVVPGCNPAAPDADPGQGDYCYVPDPSGLLARCRDFHSFSTRALDKSQNFMFQRNAWTTGCNYAEEEASQPACEARCDSCNGCACLPAWPEGLQCPYNRCSGGNCNDASKLMCRLACANYFSAGVVLVDGNPYSFSPARVAVLQEAQATFFFEDFDSLALQPFPTGESQGDGADWLDLPAAQANGTLAGWTMTKNAGHTPGPHWPTGNGIAAWDGWTFSDLASWNSVHIHQNRDLFALGSNAFAVADSDEFDDGGPRGGTLFNATLTTPPIDISAAAPGALVLTFDSTWRDTVGYPTQATVVASFDGAPVELLRRDEDTLTAYSETVVVPLNNPAGAGSMTISWWYTGSNAWWWAIDNIDVRIPTNSGGVLRECQTDGTWSGSPVDCSVANAPHDPGPATWPYVGLGGSWQTGGLYTQSGYVGREDPDLLYVSPHQCQSGRCGDRCGPNFGGQVCDCVENPISLYCNEVTGWCGNTGAHENAQPSTTYDCNGDGVPQFHYLMDVSEDPADGTPMEQCIAACDPSSGSGHMFATDSSGAGASASACAMFTLFFVGPETDALSLKWACQFYSTTRIRTLDPAADTHRSDWWTYLGVADSVGLTAGGLTAGAPASAGGPNPGIIRYAISVSNQPLHGFCHGSHDVNCP